jgi:predicted permease
MNDLEFAWRVLRKSPAFTITAILTLGLAIGANTAVFSLVDAMLLRPLPYAEPDRLGLVTRVVRRGDAVLGETTSHEGVVWEAVRDHVPSARAAAWSGLSARVSLVSRDAALAVAPQRVSAGFFAVLGVAPLMGREFTSEEDRAGGPNAAVLSHRLWQSAFGGDPTVVGNTIRLRGEPHAVVAVMPATFRTAVDADLWTPLRASRTGEGEGDNYGIMVRAGDGAPWAQVLADVAAAANPALANRGRPAGVTVAHAITPLQEGLTSGVRQPLLLLLGAVALVLLVACINLAGLQLARAGARAREIATRLAVGGDRRVVVLQLLIESLTVAVAGGLTGLVVGVVALEGLKALAGDVLLAWREVAIDGRVLLATTSLTLVTAVLTGLTPALHATRVDLVGALASGSTRAVAGGSGGWTRRLLVVGEVALGVVLLVGAGLLIRTFIHLQSQPPGFDSRNLFAASASLEDARYADHARVARLFDTSLERIRAIPGVTSAAVSLGLPYERILNMGAQIVGADGQVDNQHRFSTATYVTPGYFETLHQPLRLGRTFADTDTVDSARVVVVNDAFVRRYLSGRDPIGQQLRMGNAVREIVGVVADVPQEAGFMDYGPLDALPGIYLPFSQFPGQGLRVFHAWFSPAWIVRTATTGAIVEQGIRRAMADVDPELPLASIRALDEVRRGALGRQRLLMTLVGLLGAAALLLSAMGIHALIASGVQERTRELGIRLALGATVGSAVHTASLPGIALAAAGLVVGTVIAYGVSSLMRGLIWGVAPDDPITFVAVGGTLLATAIVASVVPALRVRRLDPGALLRE